MIKKIKPLVFACIIASIVAFTVTVFYPLKDLCLLSLKSLFFESPNIGYYNYEKYKDKFVVTDEKEHFLFINNINSFVKNIKIKLNKPLDKDVSLKLFVYDNELDKSLLIFDTKNNNTNTFNIKISRNIKNIIMTVGEKTGDFFFFDSVNCDNKSFSIKDIRDYDLFSSINTIIFWIRFFILFFFFFFVFLHFLFSLKDLYCWLYKNRYYLALGIIVFAITFELNNSSIDLWSFLNTNGSQKQSDIIFGQPRDIRSDEWSVYTPMLLSQSPDYKYFNDSLRGGNTDVFMLYGQPIKNIVCVFRPFLLGFLFLGSAKGLSFFWIVRLVLLFLFSFEFLMLITNKNKLFSLMGTFLITFAPVVQWWWTPTGIVEMIIYGELLVLLLNNYVIQKSYIKRTLEIFIGTVLIGSYIFVLYPAWQVPMVYIFVIIVLWVLIEKYKEYKFDKKDILPISIFAVLFFVVICYIYEKSKGTIDLITHTVYPGLRFETGGYGYTEYSIGCDSFIHFFRYWGNIFLSFTVNNLKTQQCNLATFFDLFPIGLIVSVIVLFKDKIKDKLLIMLLCLCLFFTVWCAVGFPKFLAQGTMLKVSPVYRTFVILSFLNVLIFVRAISLVKYSVNKIYSFVISFLLTVLILVSNIHLYEDYFDFIKITVVSVLSLMIFYLILRNKSRKLLTFLIVTIMITSGALTNPINKGIDVINNIELSKVIKKINSENKGLWIVDGFDFYVINFPIAQGVKTLNSTNTYPNIELLNKLDEDNKYNDVYNRYAHILINLVAENNMTDKFVLSGGVDTFQINMTVKDILKLNVDYVLTNRSLNEFNNDNINFEELYYGKTKIFDVYIYKINKIDKTGEI